MNSFGNLTRFRILLLAFAIIFAVATSPGDVTFAQEFGPWSTPTNLGPTVNSACNDMHPTLSRDGLTLIFSSNRPSDPGEWFTASNCASPTQFRLWVSHFDAVNQVWQTPKPLTSLLAAPDEDIYGPDNNYGEDHAPNLTTDGHWLFFHSQRPGGCNGGIYRELWAAHRHDARSDNWEAPINLGCTLNIHLVEDAGPNFWEDDSTGMLYLYFTRDLLRNGPGADSAGNGFDIYVSTCVSDLDSCNRLQLWGAGEKVGLLNSSVRDTRTAVRRRDGLEMIVTSSRCNPPIPPADSVLCTNNLSAGRLDLWVSTRRFPDVAQDNWSFPPVNLNADNQAKCALIGIDPASCPVVNTTANDAAPALSWDGQTLILWSNRPGGFGGNDLYVSTRKKLSDLH